MLRYMQNFSQEEAQCSTLAMSPLGSRKVLQEIFTCIHKIRELALRDGKPDKTAASKGEIKTIDCRDKASNPCEQSVTKPTDHRLGNSTILLELNLLSRLNYSVNFFSQ